MLRDKLLDTSNYPESHPLFTNVNKARLGFIKDEVEGESIIEAVLLKPKAYSMKTSCQKTDKKTVKGIQKCVRKAIPHEEYVKVFKTQEEVSKSVRRFQSKQHIVHTIKQTKWALSVADNKRAWIEINYSLPFGHYKINNNNDKDDTDDDDASTTLSEQSISLLDINDAKSDDDDDDEDEPVSKRMRLSC